MAYYVTRHTSARPVVRLGGLRVRLRERSGHRAVEEWGSVDRRYYLAIGAVLLTLGAAVGVFSGLIR